METALNTAKFKARTEHINKSAPKCDGYYLVAPDIGYSAVKYFAPGCHGAFPALAVEAKIKNPIEGIETFGGQIFQLYDFTTNKLWIVGDDAFDYTDSINASSIEASLYNRDGRYGELFRILTATSVAVSICNDKTYGYDAEKDKLIIQTGAPHTYEASDAAKIIRCLSGNYHFKFSQNGNDWKEFSYTLDESNIFVTSQPKGTFRSIMVDPKGQLLTAVRDYLNSSMLIVDPGFMTLDYFAFKKGKIVGNGYTDADLGMKEVFKRTINAINEKYASSLVKELSLIEFQKNVLAKGFFWIRSGGKNENIPLAPFLEKACNSVCEDAIRTIEGTLPGGIMDLDYLVLTGGTGQVWYNKFEEYIREFAPATKLLKGNNAKWDESPVYANARGYYFARHNLLSSNAK